MRYITAPMLLFFVLGLLIPNAFAENVPDWVKNTAGWWADGIIDDNSFVSGIEYLVKEDIIRVDVLQTTETSQAVPEWVKNTAGWWASDAISEKDFVNAFEFLIKEGIIQVETKSIDHNKILGLFENKVENIDEGKPQKEKIANLSTSYNSFGFRGAEFSKEKPDDIFRIFAIGGSTTFGVGVENEFTWPSYLQMELDSIESLIRRWPYSATF